MYGKVLVKVIEFGCVMPVVKLRGRNQPTQRTKLKTQIGVYQRRVNGNKDDVGKDRSLGKAQQVDRNIGKTACDGDINQVESRAGEPVH